MRSVIVTGVARADLAVVDQLTGLGVATVHEVIGPVSYTHLTLPTTERV